MRRLYEVRSLRKFLEIQEFEKKHKKLYLITLTNNMSNIYELPQEVESAMNLYLSCFNEETGEQTAPDEVVQGISIELEKLQNKQNEVIEWCLIKRANSEATIYTLITEGQRLLERAKREEKTLQKMDNLIAHFLPDIEKKVTIGNWDISYTKSEGTIVIDPLLLPEELQVHTLVPIDSLYDNRAILEEAGIAYNIETKAPLKEVKAWLESLSDEEREAVKDNVRIEQRKKLKIK